MRHFKRYREPYIFAHGGRFALAVLLFLLAAVPVNLVLGYLAYKDIDLERYRINLEARTLAENLRINIGSNFQHIVSDLMYFANSAKMYDMLDSQEYIEPRVRDFLIFSRYRGFYDQLRVLDNKGEELVRVNLAEDGMPFLVPNEGLQYKEDRYYFRQVIGLNRGEVYVSPFDLNIENRKVEIPYKPVIRFGTPVFDSSNEKKGILIFNYLGKYLIQDFREISSGSPGQAMLLDSAGYWLTGGTPEDEWGFMFDDGQDKTMARTDPKVWAEVSRYERGQFISPAGFYVFETVYPLLEGWKTGFKTHPDNVFEQLLEKEREYFWKIVLMVPSSYYLQKRNEIAAKYFYIGIVFSIMIAVGAWRVSRENLFKAVIYEKTALLHEIHHRVRNNLQILLSLNNIQARRVRDNEEALSMLMENQSRIMAMALMQDELYRKEEITSIDLKAYFNSIVRNDFSISGVSSDKISCNISVGDIRIHVDQLIPCGMIANELLLNAMKYAFGDAGGEIGLSMRQIGDGQVELVVSDNGIGMPDTIDFEESDTVGFILVRSLVQQIEGSASVESHAGGRGTSFTISFPLEQA